MSSYGFAVVEINQASWQPCDVHGVGYTREEAEDIADQFREETAQVGRRETFVVVELVVPEDDD